MAVMWWMPAVAVFMLALFRSSCLVALPGLAGDANLDLDAVRIADVDAIIADFRNSSVNLMQLLGQILQAGHVRQVHREAIQTHSIRRRRLDTLAGPGVH